MSAESALQKYATAKAAVAEHIADNESVFKAHEQLVFKVIDAENEVRDEVAAAGRGLSDGLYRVSCDPQTQTFGDIEAIDRLIASGKIPGNLREQIVKTVTRPARITISQLKG